jgi:hypothetical protein
MLRKSGANYQVTGCDVMFASRGVSVLRLCCQEVSNEVNRMRARTNATVHCATVSGEI